MSAFVKPDDDREHAARTRAAWAAYRDELATLEGAEYEDAEAAAWEQLQAALRDLEPAPDGVSSHRATA